VAMVNDRPATTGTFGGYHRNPSAEPDRYLTSVERGTPGGEFMRRYWHPVAYEHELGRVPLRVRALAEDLVIFKDLSGRIGALQMRCAHRNTSLEFGIITQDGLRCCYHGREYAIDGTCVDMPGDLAANRLRDDARQGAYPTHVFAGIVFVYMGPPDRIPVFPMLDRFDLPGVTLETGIRLDIWCNWLQMKENTVDPHHTAVLHVIPHMRGESGFAAEFGNSPELSWVETPGGCIYLGARRVDDMVWVRSGEIVFPTVHTISSVFEHGRAEKYSSAPFMTFWTLPIDNEHSVQFYLSHLVDGDTMPREQRSALEQFGQSHDQRPYSERQWIPGDVDAQEGQGAINTHATEHLGSLDRGVVLFRRQVRRGIEAVEAGRDPIGFYLTNDDVPPTYANDFVAPAASMGVDVNDPGSLRECNDRVWEKYQERSPMQDYRTRVSR